MDLEFDHIFHLIIFLYKAGFNPSFLAKFDE
jgi:hypothetical protein